MTEEFPALLARGCRTSAEGRHAEALALFQQACRLQPENPVVWHNQAGVLLILGNVPEAGFCYQQAIAFDARAVESHFGLVRVRLAQRQEASALGHLNTIRNLMTDATIPEWHYLSGIANHLAKDLAKALECFQAAAALRHPAARSSIVKLFQRALPPINAQLLSDTALVADIVDAIPSQKQRWRFAQSVSAAAAGEVTWFELWAKTFSLKQEFAYAARAWRACEAAGCRVEVATCPNLAEICRWITGTLR